MHAVPFYHAVDPGHWLAWVAIALDWHYFIVPLYDLLF